MSLHLADHQCNSPNQATFSFGDSHHPHNLTSVDNRDLTADDQLETHDDCQFSGLKEKRGRGLTGSGLPTGRTLAIVSKAAVRWAILAAAGQAGTARAT